MGLLPGFLGREEFDPLNRYLAGDSDGLKRLQLAERIADTFDQYTLFRPEMLLGGKREGKVSGRRCCGASWQQDARGSIGDGSRMTSAVG